MYYQYKGEEYERKQRLTDVTPFFSKFLQEIQQIKNTNKKAFQYWIQELDVTHWSSINPYIDKIGS